MLSLAPLLDEALLRLCEPLPADRREKLLHFLALLAQWNRTYNLTSIRDPAAMLKQHLVDCLATIAPLRRETVASTGRRLLDVGSGAGLPGIIIAIAAPEFHVTCVDSVGKKTAFVAHAAGSLGLPNVVAIHDRVESLDVAPFDVIVSRAFSSLVNFVESTRGLLAPGGIWMAMKGKRPEEELASLEKANCLFHVEPLVIPNMNAERCLVWVEPPNEASTR